MLLCGQLVHRWRVRHASTVRIIQYCNLLIEKIAVLTSEFNRHLPDHSERVFFRFHVFLLAGDFQSGPQTTT